MIIFTLSAAASLALALSLGLLFWGPGQESRISGDPAVERPGEDRPYRAVQDPSVQAPRDAGRTGRKMPADQLAAQEIREKRDRTAAVEVREDRNRPAAGEIGETGAQAAGRHSGEHDHDPLIDRHLTIAVMEMDSADQVQWEPLRLPEGPRGDSSGVTDPFARDLMPETGDQEEILIAQEIVPEERPGRWIVGAVMSPLFSYRDADASAIGTAESHESGMLAYSGGVQVGYRAASKLALETGLFFTKMGVRIGSSGIQLLRNAYEIDFSPAEGIGSERSQVTAVSNSVGNIVATTGQVYVNSYLLNGKDPANSFADLVTGGVINAEEGISQHLEYLELPFNLRYTLVDRDLELQVVGGMSTNFLIRNYVTSGASGSTEQIGYLANIRNVNYSGNAGLGMIYHISSSFSFRVEPRFRYFLNSVNDESLPSTRPYTLGLYTGLNFVF